MALTRSNLILTFAGSAFILAIYWLLKAGFDYPWRSIAAITLFAAAYGSAIGAITLLAIGTITSSRRLPWIAGLLVFCTAIAIAQFASNAIAQASRESETQQALEAGLENDCRVVFAKYQHDRELEKDGHVRIFPGSNEFNSLPLSIRMFNPIYITIEDHPFGSDIPPNIGLCKNGFGGFAFGVRVFMDDKNIPEPFWRKQLSSTVYLWQEET